MVTWQSATVNLRGENVRHDAAMSVASPMKNAGHGSDAGREYDERRIEVRFSSRETAGFGSRRSFLPVELLCSFRLRWCRDPLYSRSLKLKSDQSRQVFEK
jgi:hypothetical protein